MNCQRPFFQRFLSLEPEVIANCGILKLATRFFSTLLDGFNWLFLNVEQ
jgi:hypothetical protein